MPFDYKKEYREFYLPPKKPHLITIPRMNFVAVHGKGDPNAPGGAYQEAMGVLYGIAFTIKMSYKGSHKMDGYFEYVVPPLEGLWHQKGVDGVDYAHKETFEWTSMIRLPEFVTPEAFDWAVQEATAKKKKNFSKSVTKTKKVSSNYSNRTFTGVKKGTYYVKMRPYRKAGSKKQYGSDTSIKEVTIR